MEKMQQRDASGNIRFGDIGILLRDQIITHFEGPGTRINFKHIGPRSTIHSVRDDAHESAFPLFLGQNEVHAGMADRTNMVVGDWVGVCTHPFLAMTVFRRMMIDLEGWLCNTLLATTGQPRTIWA